MREKEFFTIPELAKILGISRIAVYKRVKKGQIEAIKVGRTYVIPKKNIVDTTGRALNQSEKAEIDKAVRKTVKEYGETLKLLGRE